MPENEGGVRTMRTWQATGVLLWTWLCALVLLYLLAVLLPPAATDGWVEVRHVGGGRWQLSEGGHLILVVLLAGALGAVADAMRSFSYHHVDRTLSSGHLIWYLQRPLLGASLAFLMYAVLRAGFLSLNNGADEVNRYGMVAAAGMVGLAAKLAALKLKAVFRSVFGAGTEDEPAGTSGATV